MAKIRLRLPDRARLMPLRDIPAIKLSAGFTPKAVMPRTMATKAGMKLSRKA
ncbi:MAG: hypothetical protein WKF84_16275 [Pyrinomonadaceae bacterium]